MSTLKSVNLIAPINTVSYGIVSLNILKKLSELVDVALWPISQPQVTCQEDWGVVSVAIEKARFYDPSAPCIRIWHQFDLAQFVGRGPHVGFPIFELDSFNKQEKHQLKSLDRIIVCSNWAKEVIAQDLGQEYADKTSVVPLGVDTDLFKPTTRESPSKYIFFNCGKWEVRKGHDILGEAFAKAFTSDDNVELWLMTNNPFCTPEEAKRWESIYINNPLFKYGKIKFIPRVEKHEDVYKIMSQVDCGIFPSRAEGWNLEALEMMSCGKPIIITDYSAHTEFCNNFNSELINIEDTELAFDNKWFFGQGNWAKIGPHEINQIADKMRKLYTNNVRYNEYGVEQARILTWNNTAEKIINVLESI